MEGCADWETRELIGDLFPQRVVVAAYAHKLRSDRFPLDVACYGGTQHLPVRHSSSCNFCCLHTPFSCAWISRQLALFHYFFLEEMEFFSLSLGLHFPPLPMSDRDSICCVPSAIEMVVISLRPSCMHAVSSVSAEDISINCPIDRHGNKPTDGRILFRTEKPRKEENIDVYRATGPGRSNPK